MLICTFIGVRHRRLSQIPLFIRCTFYCEGKYVAYGKKNNTFDFQSHREGNYILPGTPYIGIKASRHLERP